MRDIFSELFATEPPDPTAAARRAMRPQLRRRFYRQAEAAELTVRLDGKPAMTPGRRPLVAPVRPLAQALAAEWNQQQDVIDPAKMPLTRLANAIIDGVAPAPGPVAMEVAKYLGSDLVCYRAEGPAALVARQAQHWDALIEFARDELGARFVLGQGVVHVAQPEAAVTAVAKAIPSQPNSSHEIWKLGALACITALTGSALIALALMQGRITADAAWAAAHVDEDWQLEQWGRDQAALAARAYRLAEFAAAAKVLELTA